MKAVVLGERPANVAELMRERAAIAADLHRQLTWPPPLVD